MSVMKRIRLDCIALLVMTFLLSMPAMSNANSFNGYRVISETPSEVVLEIQSTYSGSHGPRVYVSVLPTIEGQDSTDFSYSVKDCNNNNDIVVGDNVTCLTISRVRGVGEVTTDAIQACMFNAVTRSYIYCESHGYIKDWEELASDAESHAAQILQQRDLAFNVLKIDPVPEMDDEKRIKLHKTSSYKVIATIVNKGGVDASEFIVRTVCYRGGENIYSMGEQSVTGLLAGSSFDVSYTIDLSKVEGGGCLIRTLVDADNQVPESDESEVSNIWESMAVVLP